MSKLAERQCASCREGGAALKGTAIQPLLAQLNGWQVVEEHHLGKTYTFPDFVSALTFVNAVGALAEQQGHHPDIHLAWGKARIELFTHSIGGLSERDFILAAKIDTLR